MRTLSAIVNDLEDATANRVYFEKRLTEWHNRESVLLKELYSEYIARQSILQLEFTEARIAASMRACAAIE